MTGANGAWRAVAIFGLGVSALGGCGPKDPPKSSPESMREARDPKILFERGRDFAKAGDLSRAEQYLVGALDGGYTPKLVLPLLLRVCVAAGNYEAAAQYGDRVLQQNPADTHLRFVVASLYQSTGDTAKARAYLEECVRREPKDADVQFALGVLLRDDVKDVVAADTYFRTYLELAPTGPHAEEARESRMKEVPRDANGVPTPDASPVPPVPTDSASAPSTPAARPAGPAGPPAPATASSPPSTPPAPRQI